MRKSIYILFFMILNIHMAYGDNYGIYTTNSAPSCDALSNSLYAVYEPIQYNCSSGYYLPANYDGCQSCPSDSICPGGTFEFNSNTYQGIILQTVSTTVVNYACADNFPNRLDAVYEPNQHNCSSGYYMPANYDGCQQCPANSYCVGGTYTFNETTPQGITACGSGTRSPAGSSSASQCIPFYTCSSGQYLPKNTTTCMSCPSGYTCAGGTYEFDANNDQGLTANSINLTWQDNDGTTITTNNCTYGQPITLPSNPTRKGYTFTGWRVVSN